MFFFCKRSPQTELKTALEKNLSGRRVQQALVRADRQNETLRRAVAGLKAKVALRQERALLSEERCGRAQTPAKKAQKQRHKKARQTTALQVAAVLAKKALRDALHASDRLKIRLQEAESVAKVSQVELSRQSSMIPQLETKIRALEAARAVPLYVTILFI